MALRNLSMLMRSKPFSSEEQREDNINKVSVCFGSLFSLVFVVAALTTEQANSYYQIWTVLFSDGFILLISRKPSQHHRMMECSLMMSLINYDGC